MHKPLCYFIQTENSVSFFYKVVSLCAGRHQTNLQTGYQKPHNWGEGSLYIVCYKTSKQKTYWCIYVKSVSVGLDIVLRQLQIICLTERERQVITGNC